jgi:hypothetical protein
MRGMAQKKVTLWPIVACGAVGAWIGISLSRLVDYPRWVEFLICVPTAIVLSPALLWVFRRVWPPA